jgi:hypothetical protein
VPIQVTVYVLTALATVVIVLTRLRLGRGTTGAGRTHVGAALVRVHTVVGVLALLIWVAFLVADSESALGSSTAGIIALALWWVVALIGLMILVRWLPSRGRHAASATEDRWSSGPALSVLAHGGMLVGVCVFTYAYLNSQV